MTFLLMFKAWTMLLYINLLIIFGLSWQVELVNILATFQSGNLTFSWTKYSKYVMINRNENNSGWIRFNDTQYTVRDVKLTDIVKITVDTGSYQDITVICKDQCVCISTKFNSGNVIFAWTTPLNITNYKIRIIRDKKYDDWTSVNDTMFTVSDALLLNSIGIDVKVPESKVENTLTYKVLKVKTLKGKSAILSWIAPFFPSTQRYHIYHTDKSSGVILTIHKTNGPGTSQKYRYFSRPYYSTNITFEIKSVTLEDAGFYSGGADVEAATLSGGVVLIVYDKPKKPEIRGNLSIPVNTSSELTCFSTSTSAPDYYSKLVTLNYTWFVNDTKMDGETRETLRLEVTRGHKYNSFSCTAKEGGLESEKSDTAQIDPMYGPDEITINPHPNMQNNNDRMITIREGDIFGPYHCFVDCNPPCNVTWTKMNSSHLNVISTNGNLSQQRINKEIELFQCVATWQTRTKKERNITINVQYLEEPMLRINNNNSSESVMNFHENMPFNVSCFVDGNPIPKVVLIKDTENIQTNMKNTNLVTHAVTSAACADTGNYTCTGQSEGFNVSDKTLRINILCNLRIDDSEYFQTKFGSKNVRVASVIPIIANPPPMTSDIAWVGPGTEQIQSNVSQRGVAYKHWINTSFPVYNGYHTYSGNYTMIYRNETILTITIYEQDFFTEMKDTFTESLLERDEVEYLFPVIGGSVAFLVLVLILVVTLVICFRRKKTKKKNERNYKIDENAQPEAEMYAVVDKRQQTGKRNRNKLETTAASRVEHEEECIEPSTETYAVVDKSLKKNQKDDLEQMSTKAGKSKQGTKQTTAKTSTENHNMPAEDPARGGETNNEGLVYIEVDFANQSEGSSTNRNIFIHGEENRTEYTFVDFSKKAPPIDDDDNNGEL